MASFKSTSGDDSCLDLTYSLIFFGVLYGLSFLYVLKDFIVYIRVSYRTDPETDRSNKLFEHLESQRQSTLTSMISGRKQN